jgi:cellulose 1,4-beta-cellobiosidase
MDIWESNSQANALTPHTCTITGQYRCSGTQCGDDSAGQRYLATISLSLFSFLLFSSLLFLVDLPLSFGFLFRYSGVCDKDGCDFNPYRMGVHNFFGVGSSFTIDTSKVSLFQLVSSYFSWNSFQPFTVVTQFLTSNGQDSGTLNQINRLYVQVCALCFSFLCLLNILLEWSCLSHSPSCHIWHSAFHFHL